MVAMRDEIVFDTDTPGLFYQPTQTLSVRPEGLRFH